MCLYVQEGNNKKASLYAHLPFTKCHYLYNTLFNAADCVKFGCLLGGWMDGWVGGGGAPAGSRQAGRLGNKQTAEKHPARRGHRQRPGGGGRDRQTPKQTALTIPHRYRRDSGCGQHGAALRASVFIPCMFRNR